MNAIDPKALRRGNRGTVRKSNPRPQDRELVRLKGRLLRRLTAESNNPVLLTRLQQAAAEAESLAWLSPFPLLVLPALLEEKVRVARLHAARQAQLRETSREWLCLSE
jgi:hypothetical protein